MLFKLDENLPASLVAEFAAADHDAVSVVTQKLGGASDATIADVCREEARVLVTIDKGFSDIRAYPPHEHPGIIVLRLRSQNVPYIVATVRRVIRLLGDHPIDKMLWIVEGDKVRFRR